MMDGMLFMGSWRMLPFYRGSIPSDQRCQASGRDSLPTVDRPRTSSQRVPTWGVGVGGSANDVGMPGVFNAWGFCWGFFWRWTLERVGVWANYNKVTGKWLLMMSSLMIMNAKMRRLDTTTGVEGNGFCFKTGFLDLGFSQVPTPRSQSLQRSCRAQRWRYQTNLMNFDLIYRGCICWEPNVIHRIPYRIRHHQWTPWIGRGMLRLWL